MKNVVITGSTRGIGNGLAREFVRKGHTVVISGRTQEACDQAVDELKAEVKNANVLGIACDVTSLAQIQDLWDKATEALGRVDIWISNAGLAHETHRFWQQPPERVEAVVKTNLLGLMYCAHVVINGMLNQGHGQIYNITGFGRRGQLRTGMTIYGTTKRAVDYFTKAMALETKATPIQVCQINPGLVITDMTREGYVTTVEDPKTIERFYNTLGESPETTAALLIDRILANKKSGILIARDSRAKTLGRWLLSSFRQRHVFTDTLNK